ncbi:hypothetical protein [Candidatus Phycosocius spiralis]|uniref:Uncharacterized protein n=1 Tax=Candidatus Phycosocius spiralis TaxID=2815099 RepID=A0ABQ4PX45_9PROT|nr:hypothetical protein [Candidatus Phycosocius spiralis]GIU67551.1 hypothetical protein PsB1_1705 [Candidatus Phycosocius spiralis]
MVTALDWQTYPQMSSRGLSVPVRVATRLGALLVWLGLGFALMLSSPQTPEDLPELQPISVAVDPLLPLPPMPKPIVRKQSLPAVSDRVANLRSPIVNSLTNTQAPIQEQAASSEAPPNAQIGASAPQGLAASNRAIIQAQQCVQLDPKDRPPDCPPNDVLKQLLERARGPHYRPKNVTAFTSNEMRWRDVPPPCLEDGESYSNKGGVTCFRIGTPPSRVRSPKEICEAKGIDACAPTPSQDAVKAALKIRNSP